MRRTAEGFTLLEIIVALAVFSIAAMALLNLAGQNMRTADALERTAFARVVAENIAVETALSAAAGPDGGGALAGSGEQRVADRDWRWTRRVSATADPGLVRVEIDVREGQSEQVAASLVMFRSR